LAAVSVLAMAGGCGPAAAEGWTAGSFDNGSWFEAAAMAPGGQVRLHCGGASPQGLPLPASDQPMLTTPGMLDLSIALPVLADPTDGMAPPRQDLALVVGTTGYRLGQAYWDPINGQGWVMPVRIDEPWLQALAAAPAFAIDSAAGRHAVLSAEGAGAALAATVAYCTARWQAAAAPVSKADLLLRAVEAAVAETCRGPSKREPGWLLQAEIDGDGEPDLMLNWILNACLTGVGLGMCAPSQCPIDIFLSSRVSVPGARESIMGQLEGVVPQGAGRGAAIRVQTLTGCVRAAVPGGCVVDWRWSGQTMEVIR